VVVIRLLIIQIVIHVMFIIQMPLVSGVLRTEIGVLFKKVDVEHLMYLMQLMIMLTLQQLVVVSIQFQLFILRVLVVIVISLQNLLKSTLLIKLTWVETSLQSHTMKNVLLQLKILMVLRLLMELTVRLKYVVTGHRTIQRSHLKLALTILKVFLDLMEERSLRIGSFLLNTRMVPCLETKHLLLYLVVFLDQMDFMPLIHN